MRLLFAICHYYHPEGGKYASLRKNPKPRIAALTRQILALHQLFGPRRCMLDIGARLAVPAGQALAAEVGVVVCTTKGRHLLEQLPLPEGMYEHVATDAEPTALGYECHAALAERLGTWDYYCYLEDDLILHDPMFFLKQAWFNRNVGNIGMLQPCRYEVTAKGPFHRVYVDGELAPEVTAEYQDVSEAAVVQGRVLGMPVRFGRARNPHAGCFFLTQDQMRHFAGRPYFLDRSAAFVGPLESAATLGVMRTFRVYKPAAPFAPFLEIEHAGTAYASLIGSVVKVGPQFGTADVSIS